MKTHTPRVILCLSAKKYGREIIQNISHSSNIKFTLISDERDFSIEYLNEYGQDLLQAHPVSQDVFSTVELECADAVIAATEDTLLNMNISMLYKSFLKVSKSIILLSHEKKFIKDYKQIYGVDVAIYEEDLLSSIASEISSRASNMNRVVCIGNTAVYFNTDYTDNKNRDTKSLEVMKNKLKSGKGIIYFPTTDGNLQKKEKCLVAGSEVGFFVKFQDKLRSLFKETVFTSESHKTCMEIAEVFANMDDVSVVHDLNFDNENLQSINSVFLSYKKKYKNLLSSLRIASSLNLQPVAISGDNEESSLLFDRNLAKVIYSPAIISASIINALMLEIYELPIIEVNEKINIIFFLKDSMIEENAHVSQEMFSNENSFFFHYDNKMLKFKSHNVLNLNKNMVCITYGVDIIKSIKIQCKLSVCTI